MSPKKKRKIEEVSSKADWTLIMIKEFIELLMKVTLCSDVQELKNHVIIECVWKKLEKKMNISHNVLKKIWNNQLHMQLFCPEPIYMSDVKIKLIEFLYGKGITSTKDIKWHNVALLFDGFTEYFLNRTFHTFIRTAKDNTDSTEFEDLISYLYTEYIPFLIAKSEDRFLPRLLYDKDNIQHIGKDLEVNISSKNDEN